ncbi:hypothetical protein LINGRAHAP2_LOCUS35272 [Linum grandiflorum]
MWQPMGRFRMVDLESDVFLATFDDSSDYFHALTGGPWMILGHYLTVYAWDSQFRISDALPQKMVVWVRFPRLPIQYYHQDILEGLGNLVGKHIRTDNRTQTSMRGKFARMAVEIDLLAPVPKGVYVDGVWQVLEYENLPTFCRKCGRFGHENGGCDRFSECHAPQVVVVPPPPIAPNVDAAPTAEPEGLWHTVVRRRRPNKVISTIPDGQAQSVGNGKGKNNHNKSKIKFRHDVAQISAHAVVRKLSDMDSSSNGWADSARPNTSIPSGSGLSLKHKSHTPTGGSVVAGSKGGPDCDIKTQGKLGSHANNASPNSHSSSARLQQLTEKEIESEPAPCKIPEAPMSHIHVTSSDASMSDPLISNQQHNPVLLLSTPVSSVIPSPTLQPSFTGNLVTPQLTSTSTPRHEIEKSAASFSRAMRGVQVRRRKTPVLPYAKPAKGITSGMASVTSNQDVIPTMNASENLHTSPHISIAPNSVVVVGTTVDLEEDFDESSDEEEVALRIGLCDALSSPGGSPTIVNDPT